MKERVLITGASGFLGSHLRLLAEEKYEVHVLTHENKLLANNGKSWSCDLTRHREIQNILTEVKPVLVYHLAAMSDPNACQLNKQKSRAINLEATVNLANLCADQNIELIFTSTDLVFDGAKGAYSEEDEVNPLSRYAEHKILAEQALFDNPFVKILRLPLMYGYRGKGKASFLEALLSKWSEGQVQQLFEDEYRTAAPGVCVAKALLKSRTWSDKLYHLGGPECLSRYEMGLLLAAHYNIDLSLIKKCLRADVKMPADRPRDVSLNSSKSFELGYEPKSFINFLKGG